jgi:hypothetical protein
MREKNHEESLSKAFIWFMESLLAFQSSWGVVYQTLSEDIVYGLELIKEEEEEGEG